MQMFYMLKHIVEWKIPNQDDYNNIVGGASMRYHHLQSMINEQFGPNGWIVFGLFVFFLILIFSIYVKSIIDTFRAGNEKEQDPDSQPDGLYYTVEDAPRQDIANDNDYENEEGQLSENNVVVSDLQNVTVSDSQNVDAEDLDKELSLSLLQASQENVGEEQRQKISSDIKKKIKVRYKAENAKLKELKQYIKDKPQSAENTQTTPKQTNSEIICLIINLLGRGVTVAKINQSLYYHYNNVYEIHDIIHTVQSVCNFIGLCNAGKFDYLPQRQMLPENDAALYAWANGDYSLVLILLQSFLNQLMEQAQGESGVIKDMTHALASNCACIMGDIAKLKDLDLAHNSFELATELSPKNVVAWCRLGDIYITENASEKAMIAYQNVIDIADVYLYASELAHAKWQLAQYYQKQEVVAKAEKLRAESKEYYDASGMYSDLTEKEILAYNTIYTGRSQNLRQYIYNLLSSYHF